MRSTIMNLTFDNAAGGACKTLRYSAERCHENPFLRIGFCIAAICLALATPLAQAQDAPVDAPALEAGPDAAAAAPQETNDQASDIENELTRMGIPQPLPFLWNLAVQGGVFMIPIALCSIVVVAFAIERRLGLQKGRIIPRGLLVSLQKLNQQNNGIDPRLAYD